MSAVPTDINHDAEITRVCCCQIKRQKSHVVTVELYKRKESVFFLTEPSGKPSVKHGMHYFSASKSARAALQVDSSLNPWLVEKCVDHDMCTISV